MALLLAGGPATAAEALKVMTFNLGMGASRFLMHRLMPAEEAMDHIAPLIAGAVGDAPAVVCLQEVDDSRRRSGRRSASSLVEGLKAAGSKGWQVHYYPLAQFDADGATGIAVLSRLDQETSATRWQIFDGGEDRGALALGLRLDGHPVWVVNTHLGFTDPAGQARALIEGLSRHGVQDDTIVLCGDFNIADPTTTPSPAARRDFEHTLAPLLAWGFSPALAATPTYPAWSSDHGMKLDYLWIRSPGRLSVRAPRAITPVHGDRYISDHRALSVDLVPAGTAGQGQ